MKTRSIAFRLISAVLLVELLSALLVVFLSLGYERHIHFRAFEVMLHGRADSVLGAVQDAEDVGDNVMLDLADLHVPPKDVYEVWDGRGHLLGRSANWQGSAGMRVPDHEGISHIKLLHHGYGLLYMRGTRIVDPGEPGGGKLRFVTILYGAPTDPVWHAIRGAVEFYAGGSLLLLAVTGPLIAWLLHRGLLPLRQLATLASTVSVDSWNFSPPASARETAELAPLTHAIENVLQRLEHSFTQQRTFVSDGAHELKTAGGQDAHPRACRERHKFHNRCRPLQPHRLRSPNCRGPRDVCRSPQHRRRSRRDQRSARASHSEGYTA